MHSLLSPVLDCCVGILRILSFQLHSIITFRILRVLRFLLYSIFSLAFRAFPPVFDYFHPAFNFYVSISCILSFLLYSILTLVSCEKKIEFMFASIDNFKICLGQTEGNFSPSRLKRVKMTLRRVQKNLRIRTYTLFLFFLFVITSNFGAEAERSSFFFCDLSLKPNVLNLSLKL